MSRRHHANLLAFVLGIHLSLVNSPLQGLLAFSILLVRTSCWTNSRVSVTWYAMTLVCRHYDGIVLRELLQCHLVSVKASQITGITTVCSKLSLTRKIINLPHYRPFVGIKPVDQGRVMQKPYQCHYCIGRKRAYPMMTSSNGNIFRVTGPVTRSCDVFFDLRLNKRLSKQSWGWWFETLLRPLWRPCNANV